MSKNDELPLMVRESMYEEAWNDLLMFVAERKQEEEAHQEELAA